MSIPAQVYSRDFYSSIADGSLRSAQIVVPLVMDLVRPRSVVDVGCGTGSWLSTYTTNGVADILGLDGNWVNTEQLRIPKEQFQHTDVSQPIRLERTFDLAMTVEVAEHLSAERAPDFVASLTRLAPVVLFSAAIPFQGGKHHVNEQWPNYWIDLFAKHDYVAIDCLRQKLWDREDVEWWYAQNILFFVRKEALASYPKLAQAYQEQQGEILHLVHPRLFVSVAKPYQELKQRSHPLKQAVKTLVKKFV